ncbi:hypothetical protein HN51_068161 [Arachis hypogaea]|uniref:uncharacterized protein LOC110271388 n=1 Tax=Arachis ipaensis TaxID=130454 RepID=UPI000A2B51F3|nr:uncharacterized protein LOC110271388 [Arachis ipaensis]XP_025650448.1 uncharacterized protein LOC112744898 [Arachis hypogaea]XP_025697178.1 uncharacterized protein LOC112798187 [Arachis hypogaea]QHO09807.1 uncharacterized protein DS421_14g484440 [Arachis hypogaea]
MASNINHQVATYYRYNYLHSVRHHRDEFRLDQPAELVLDSRDNYQGWRQAMNLELESRKMLWFVHGTDKEVMMNEPKIYREWEDRKEHVLSWILDSISEKIKIIIAEDSSNNEVGLWKALMKFFSHHDHQSIISDIKEEIKSLRQERRTLMEYKIKFDALWMEYDMLDVNNDKSKREQERAKRFLEGLNATFDKTRSLIKKQTPFPSLENFFDLVAREDHDEALIFSVHIQDQPVKVHTGIDEKQPILLSDIHVHELKPTPAGAPYRCDGCKERGCGRSYRCEEKNCSKGYVLHEECANAVLHRQDKKSHPFFEGQEFEFRDKVHGKPRVCNACRMDVRGFVYHSEARKKDTGLDLHPCCLNLSREISYEDSGATKTLTLKRDVPENCVQCKRKKVGDDIKVKGWSYSTSDGDYCYHVSCFKELFLESLSNYFPEKKMQTNTVENNKKVAKVRGPSTSKDNIFKIATLVLKIIFSALFGDPVSFVLALVEGTVTAAFNN